MSVSTEVQRTLVKSPPELWSELSNPEALARHLSELGEIRITSVEPETKVEWESERASGVVHLKQSGWGTKVTLSVTRTAPAREEPQPEPEASAEPSDAKVESELHALEELQPEPVALQPEPVTVEPKPVALESEPVTVEPKPVALESEVVVVEPEPDTIAVESEAESLAGEPKRAVVVELDPEPSPAQIEPQLGFFARLFSKRKAKLAGVVESEPQPNAAAEPDVAAEPEPKVGQEIEVVALAAPEPVYPAYTREGDASAQPQASGPAANLATELESLEDQMTAETAELLTGVLDRLGAAHHRPFSRS